MDSRKRQDNRTSHLCDRIKLGVWISQHFLNLCLNQQLSICYNFLRERIKR
jgi:hypothetical protein